MLKKAASLISNRLKQRITPDHMKIYQICKPQKNKYILTGIMTVAHSAFFMYLPNIYTDINYLLTLRVSTMDTTLLRNQYLMIYGKWALLIFAVGLLNYWRRYNFLDISNRIGIRMRTVAFHKVMQSDLYKQNANFQTYLHHMITDIKAVSEFAGQTGFMGLRGLFFLTGSTICLLWQSPLICLIATAIMIGFNFFYRPRNIKLKYLKQQENLLLIKLSEHISERLYNIRLIKICHTEALEKLKLNNTLSKFYQYAKKVSKASGFNFASLESLGLLSIFTIVTCGSLLISLQISTFSLMSSATYALFVSMGFRSCIYFNIELMKIMGVYKILQSKIGSIHDDPDYSRMIQGANLQDLCNVEKVQQQSRQMKQLKSTGITLRIENLSYNYIVGQNNHQIYTNFNQEIQAGNVVALVGPSGVGKSTLLNLLTKLSDPTSGNIYFDGVPLSMMTFKDIQHKVSYVTQQNFLFKGTLFQNLIYGNHGFDCSQQNLVKCLKLTNAYSFCMKKGGLDMQIEARGNNLSGGQKQRIIIARALVKHPRLLLLDEATAGVDSASEKIIIDSLEKSRKGMTIIIITHKLENFLPIITKFIELKAK